MPFEMRLWQVDGGALEAIAPTGLNQEQRLEDWIEKDPGILGMNLAVFGRQVQTPFGGRVDLLALDSEANCVIIELKKARTPREVVAQLLDYASWVVDLTFDEIDHISQACGHGPVGALYQSAFGSTMPESVNTSHHMILVAAELDSSSERIIGYLTDRHDVSINAVFFTFFSKEGKELLGRAWLRDPVVTIERSEAKKRRPWAGYWFVNVGDGAHRSWEDNRQYGYIGAGGGEQYSRPLQNLKPGDKIFAYMKGLGYVGYGEVTRPATPVKDFDVSGTPLLKLPLKATRVAERADDSDRAEWAVGVRWINAVDRQNAKKFPGIFANQNIVCKLRDQATVDFLRGAFGIKSADESTTSGS